MSELTAEEWVALEKKYQTTTFQTSVILEGPACAFVRDKKKRAGQWGSRGKYLSHCVRFYETHKLERKNLEDEIESLWKTINRLS